MKTGIPAYKWALGILAWIFFIMMGLSYLFLTLSPVKMPEEQKFKLREGLRKGTFKSLFFLVLGMAVGFVIFTYVNSIIGLVYIGSVLLIQLTRHRMLTGRI